MSGYKSNRVRLPGKNGMHACAIRELDGVWIAFGQLAIEQIGQLESLVRLLILNALPYAQRKRKTNRENADHERGNRRSQDQLHERETFPVTDRIKTPRSARCEAGFVPAFKPHCISRAVNVSDEHKLLSS